MHGEGIYACSFFQALRSYNAVALPKSKIKQLIRCSLLLPPCWVVPYTPQGTSRVEVEEKYEARPKFAEGLADPISKSLLCKGGMKSVFYGQHSHLKRDINSQDLIGDFVLTYAEKKIVFYPCINK